MSYNDAKRTAVLTTASRNYSETAKKETPRDSNISARYRY
jgi:hypothetical protein